MCELQAHPENYTRQFVRVRGRTSLEFEYFGIWDPACPLKPDSTSVWLKFGGDEAEAVIYCCGNHDNKKGRNIILDGIPVPLIRDSQYKKFRNDLSAGRGRHPDGRVCGDECLFYRVTATITGLFLAKPAQPEDVFGGGYGHFGSYHLLVISQVSNVASERTAVPAGGRFKCSKDDWKLLPKDVASLGVSMECEGVDRECEKLAFATIAAHWGDPFDPDRGGVSGYRDINGDLLMDWLGEDLQTSYSTRTRATGEISITRNHCIPSEDSPAFAESRHIGCVTYFRSGIDEATKAELDRTVEANRMDIWLKRTAQEARKLFAVGDQIWRRNEISAAAWHALQLQAKEWNVSLARDLIQEPCEVGDIDEAVWRSCSWSSRDGMESFSVNLMQYKLPGSASPEWVVTRLDGRICRPEP